MTTLGYTLFGTAIGHCGLAWGEHGVTAVHLPDGNPAAMRARLRAAFPEAAESTPPAEVQAAIDDIVALLNGERRDLLGITVDYQGVPEFNRRVYEIARTIPPGRTLTYGDIAHRLGMPGSAQAVGQALGHNPFPIVVPCHRVLAAGRRMGGFSARGGVETKRQMLIIEGADVQPTLF
ncbi:methylated-DNA--[protein]-cysteine S-methyltransferase [Amycolatopsis granulosa]|uniref:methylated-DNA--[protein]-cysteine S-methyltransferase n=1 Tax=Amycolatopsis granulosa TaxID=185684 RepID=UPI0014232057|nr:methylated-DNA--[protein]-cysteine S-methyltransferase [Amycolatopsis granulosa]NIH85298.1 methylated-DNA-[protein]-cysteine S-methyltransferase [Amycolatopsis granulosa]